MQSRILIFCALGALVTGCQEADVQTPENPHILVFGVDGLRADALKLAKTPNIDAWIEGEGVEVRWDGGIQQTAPQAISGPGWASMLTGAEPAKTKVIANYPLNIDPAWPTFLLRAHQNGYRVGLSANWSGILELVENEATDIEFQKDADDPAVAQNAAEWIAADEVDIAFVSFNDVDEAGHLYGFTLDTPEYLAAIEEIDGLFGEIHDAIMSQQDGKDWLIWLATDHGGDKKGLIDGHGTRNPENETIPLFASTTFGSLASPEHATHLDVAPTALDWLSVPYPAEDLDGTSWYEAP